MIWLLDTDSFSYGVRNEGTVGDRMLARPINELALPAPTLYEIRSGLLRLPRGARRRHLTSVVDQLLTGIRVLPFDAAAAEASAAARIALDAAGTPIGTIDLQIAGIALACDATLITRDVREFSRVEGLRLENWYVAQSER